MVKGPRQSGKSTLATRIARTLNATYVSLDEPEHRAAATDEPGLFVEPAANGLMVIDEVQRGGEDLLLSIKAAIDQTGRRGQFLLTGSANYLMLPRISESLQGRIAISTLYPFSQGESSASEASSFIDAAFDDAAAISRAPHRRSEPVDYWELISTGGYPEVQQRGPAFRSGWFDQLIESTISREIADLGGIANQAAVSRVLSQCAALSSQELNLQSLVRAAGIARQTANQYLGWLNAAHLVHLVPAWRRSLARRQIKSPKILVTDSGLACHLVGKDGFALSQGTDVYRGQALETFVGVELLKQLGWGNTNARLYHWRTVRQSEVDFVIESSDGRILGFEAKASTSPARRSGSDLAKLRDEVDRAGGTFVHGFVLHPGERSFPLGERITALPVKSLWTAATPDLPSHTAPIAVAEGSLPHEQAISAIGELPESAALTFHLRPNQPRRRHEFLQASLPQLSEAFTAIAQTATPGAPALEVQRDFLSYRVIKADPGMGEYACGKLWLNGSSAWLSPIRTFEKGSGPRTSRRPRCITATETVFAIAVGLKAVSEWAGRYCEVDGRASLSVQFHTPPNGVELGQLAAAATSPQPSPGIRPVEGDLPPIATEIDLGEWQTGSAVLLHAARHIGEHVLAAFGLVGVQQIGDHGQFRAAGIEAGLRSHIPKWANTDGLA